MQEQDVSRNGAQASCSKLPFIVAALALIIAMIFGFGVTQNLSGLQDEVARLADRSAEQAALDGVRKDVATLRARLDGIGDLDAVARKAIFAATVQDLSQKVGLLAATAGNDEQARKLNDIMRLMQEIQTASEK